jgi:bacterioferritin-associated ferredoxin
MDLDDQVCLCFRVTKRKLVNFVRIHQPRVASQLSECGGAGTGCGWCVPFLKQIHRQGTNGEEMDTLSAEEYRKQRAEYVKAGKGTPPPGAEM